MCRCTASIWFMCYTTVWLSFTLAWLIHPIKSTLHIVLEFNPYSTTTEKKKSSILSNMQNIAHYEGQTSRESSDIQRPVLQEAQDLKVFPQIIFTGKYPHELIRKNLLHQSDQSPEDGWREEIQETPEWFMEKSSHFFPFQINIQSKAHQNSCLVKDGKKITCKRFCYG